METSAVLPSEAANTVFRASLHKFPSRGDHRYLSESLRIGLRPYAASPRRHVNHVVQRFVSADESLLGTGSLAATFATVSDGEESIDYEYGQRDSS